MGEIASAAEQNASRRAAPPLLYMLIAVVALATAASGPYATNLPAVAISVGAYCLLPIILPSARLRRSHLVGPANWGLLYFGLTLIVMPVVVIWSGPRPGALRLLPSDLYINLALLLNTLAFIAFAIGLSIPARARTLLPHPILPVFDIGVVYCMLGFVGMLLAFGSVSGILDYFGNPAAALLARESEPTTIGAAAATFLRPFLMVGPVLVWSWWARDHGGTAPAVARWVRTGVVILVITLAGATFSFNRAAVLTPIIALIAMYSRTIRRISAPFLIGMGCVALSAALAAGTFRSSNVDAGDALADPAIRDALARAVDPVEQLQIYGGAPQFLGFLLEANDFSDTNYWGRTLLASALLPVPILGKPLRDQSGVVLFNRLIYGDGSVVDQVIPFQGELFLNFHIPGVVVAFVLLGMAMRRLEIRIDSSRDPVEQYAVMYIAIWLCFLILGSLASVSQIFVYFCWPIYVYAVLRWASSARAQHRGTLLAPT